MNNSNESILKQLWSILRPYFTGNKKRQALFLLFMLLLFVFLMAGINAYKTYLTKWAINALTDKNQEQFYFIIKIAVISLILSAPIVALHEYYTKKLSIFWRKWFNNNLLTRYFTNRAYYKMSLFSDVDNPDQRIAEDLNNFTDSATEFFAIISLSIISFLTYIGVLWSISPKLVLAVLIYATVGTIVILLVSRTLVVVNFLNIKFQANYRYNLVHARDNIESIAFYGGEQHEEKNLKSRFNTLFNNLFRLIKIQRNISFAGQIYILMSALCPFLILAPGIFAGTIKIGTLVQSVTVFAAVLTDLSFIVLQFQNLATFAAVIRRLSGFTSALATEPPPSKQITFKSGDTFQVNNATIQTPDLRKTLVKDLDFSLEQGKSIMISGPSGCGKSSLLRSIAGLWNAGEGEIIKPPAEQIMFLPQKPYMLIGSLREQLVYPQLERDISDAELEQALKDVNLGDLIERVGDLDTVMPWADLLSLGEQQRIIFLRLFLFKPRFAILDESTSALDEPNEALLYGMLKDSDISYISVGHRSSLLPYHDHFLKLDNEQGWKMQ